jgi:hypothetical protein
LLNDFAPTSPDKKDCYLNGMQQFFFTFNEMLFSLGKSSNFFAVQL